MKLLLQSTKLLKKRAAHHVYAYSRLSNEYYQAVIDWMQRRHQFHVEKDWIVFTPGVVVALTLGVQAVTEPGEEVMILSPVYGPFRGATTACGRKLIESPLVNNDGYYTIDFEDMEKRVTPNTKAFMLCSPHNPVDVYGPVKSWKALQTSVSNTTCT